MAQPAADPGAAREAVIAASRRLEAALRRREAAADTLRAAPGAPCGALLRRGDAAVAAWDRLRDAWRTLGATDPTAGAGSALAQLGSQRELARAYRDRWATWCAGRPALGPAVRQPMEAVVRCGPAWQRGAVINWVEPDASPLQHPRDTAALLERVAVEFSADWRLALVLDGPGDPRAADGAVLRIAGRAAAAGADPRHLPAWPQLLGAAVLPGERLADTAALRGILRIFALPTRWPGCGGAPAVGWGAAEIGGQLGGARPGGLAALGDGRWRLTGPGGRAAGQIASGGDSVPYAPLELALLGLQDPAELPPVSALRAPEWLGPGEVRAQGRCRVAPAILLAGRPSLPPGPWRVGLIVRSRQPLKASALAQLALELAELAAPGPDPLPHRLNFHEATGGRGALAPSPARPRACSQASGGIGFGL